MSSVIWLQNASNMPKNSKERGGKKLHRNTVKRFLSVAVGYLNNKKIERRCAEENNRAVKQLREQRAGLREDRSSAL